MNWSKLNDKDNNINNNEKMKTVELIQDKVAIFQLLFTLWWTNIMTFMRKVYNMWIL